MIKVTKDTTVIAGELTEILSEITTVINKVYTELKEVMGEEEALKRIVEIGNLATMSEEQVEEYINNKKKGLS